MSLRVVAGKFRGRRLSTPEGSSTRPTSERVREATFNALNARGLLVGTDVVDLFAGSGALGIEALSRGASTATFVDMSAPAIRVLNDNLRSLELEDVSTVVRGDAMSFVLGGAHGVKRFDLALLDPPYEFDQWDDLLERLDVEALVIESDRNVLDDDRFGESGNAPYEVVRERRYGTTFVTIAQRRTSADRSALRKDRQ